MPVGLRLPFTVGLPFGQNNRLDNTFIGTTNFFSMLMWIRPFGFQATPPQVVSSAIFLARDLRCHPTCAIPCLAENLFIVGAQYRSSQAGFSFCFKLIICGGLAALLDQVGH
jgi:hypothetical protein